MADEMIPGHHHWFHSFKKGLGEQVEHIHDMTLFVSAREYNGFFNQFGRGGGYGIDGLGPSWPGISNRSTISPLQTWRSMISVTSASDPTQYHTASG
jgi:hypothetical protein